MTELATPPRARKRSATSNYLHLATAPALRYRKKSVTTEKRTGVVIPPDLRDQNVIARFFKQDGSPIGNQIPIMLDQVSSHENLINFITHFTRKPRPDLPALYELSIKYGDADTRTAYSRSSAELEEEWENDLHKILINMVGRTNGFISLQIILVKNLDIVFDSERSALADFVDLTSTSEQSTNSTTTQSSADEDVNMVEGDNIVEPSSPTAYIAKRRTRAVKSDEKETMEFDSNGSENTRIKDEIDENIPCFTQTLTTNGGISPLHNLSVGSGPTSIVQLTPSKKPLQKADVKHTHRSPYFLKEARKQRKYQCQKEKGLREAHAWYARTKNNAVESQEKRV